MSDTDATTISEIEAELTATADHLIAPKTDECLLHYLGAWVSNGFSGAGARRERIGAVRWALRWRSAGKFWWVCFTFAAG